MAQGGASPVPRQAALGRQEPALLPFSHRGIRQWAPHLPGHLVCSPVALMQAEPARELSTPRYHVMETIIPMLGVKHGVRIYVNCEG